MKRLLQQVHYWLTISKHRIYGKVWVYNSYEAWNEQFPFWSFSMVKRIIRSLEKSGYLLSGNYNKLKMDQTKWYSINYDKVEQLGLKVATECKDEEGKSDDSIEHKKMMNSPHETVERNNLNKPIPKTTTEITTDNYLSYRLVMDHLNT